MAIDRRRVVPSVRPGDPVAAAQGQDLGQDREMGRGTGLEPARGIGRGHREPGQELALAIGRGLDQEPGEAARTSRCPVVWFARPRAWAQAIAHRSTAVAPTVRGPARALVIPLVRVAAPAATRVPDLALASRHAQAAQQGRHRARVPRVPLRAASVA